MATFTEPDVLSEDIANKIHDFNSDTFRWVLSNTAPAVGTTFLLSNITQISTSGGYTQMTDGAGGLTTTLSFSRSGQTTTRRPRRLTRSWAGLTTARPSRWPRRIPTPSRPARYSPSTRRP
jgi:hypothetical protein